MSLSGKHVRALAAAFCLFMFVGCAKKGSDVVELVWYQIGDAQKDAALVLQKVNEYTEEKLGVRLKINTLGWGDFPQKIQVVINTGDTWDLAFTSAWANDYLQNSQRGAFLALDDLLPQYGKEMYDRIDPRFWEAAKVNGKIYGVPHEKEINSLPMWVFTKDLVEKYNVPYQDLHTLEDLEPWLKLIQENEPGVVPLYLMGDRVIPSDGDLDLIVDPVGIAYENGRYIAKSSYDDEDVINNFNTLRRFYLSGYINKDAGTAINDKSVRRFVGRSDGQPFADIIWSRDLGYEVVTSSVLETKATNYTARGAMTAINKNSRHPEKALQLLNLINTDEYLRNLLNYGIEGVHWERVPVSDEEKAAAAGRPYVYDFKIRLIEGRSRDYQTVYWVQGGLFTTYVTENEPLDKWAVFKDFNDSVENAPTFGFDFNIDPVSTEAAGFFAIREEFGRSLNTGTVDPAEAIAELNRRYEVSGIARVIDEVQRQFDQWQSQR